MDNLSKRQKKLKKEIAAFSKNNLNDPNYFDEFSYEMWDKISKTGFLGLTLPKKFEGLEESYKTAAVLYEELGYSCENNGFVFVVNNHVWVCQNIINSFGNEKIKDRFLLDMSRGVKIGCIAITEADSGSDATSMNMNYEVTSNNYVLNGNKVFISNAPISDVILVFAVDKSDKDNMTAFLVEKENPGIKIGKTIKKMGLESCPTAEIYLSDCKIDKDNIVGKLGQGETILANALEWERIFEFVPYIGAMRRVMEKCIVQAKNNRQFGRKMDQYQAVSHKIADMKIKIQLSEALLEKIIEIKDKNRMAFEKASIFKIFVSESYVQTCRDAVQLFGIYGCNKDSSIEKELWDSLASTIHSGTNEMQRNTIYDFTAMRF